MLDYWKIGTALRDEIVYLNKVTFAGVTGKVQGDFTIKLTKNGVGNQATTGITILETDAVNTPGVYSILVSGTTGFVAATGEYTLRIFDTASPGYAWESTYVVTSDGTGEGTLGSASFTSVSGNGRITDGTSAISGATVYIRDPSGVLYAALTSDAAGLWGPVYLNRDGTFTVYAQRAGYSVVSATIVVSGTTATGPAIDIALAAVATGSGLTLSELMSYGRRMVRDSSGAKADADIKGCVNDSLGMIAREQLWPWYQREGRFTLRPSYSTGTLTLTNASAVVTLVGGTFPTWLAANDSLEINGQWHKILTRDSGAQVTLLTAWAEASASLVTFVAFRDEYTLPTDCLRFGRLFPGETWSYGGAPTSYEDVLRAKSGWLGGQRYPASWAIHKNYITVWPYSDTTVGTPFFYYIKPATLANVSDEADWDTSHLELLQRAIDYQLAIRFGATVSGDSAVCYARYQAALAKARPADKTQAKNNNPLGGNPNPFSFSRLLP